MISPPEGLPKKKRLFILQVALRPLPNDLVTHKALILLTNSKDPTARKSLYVQKI